jgi:hypothetical protein
MDFLKIAVYVLLVITLVNCALDQQKQIVTNVFKVRFVHFQLQITHARVMLITLTMVEIYCANFVIINA